VRVVGTFAAICGRVFAERSSIFGEDVLVTRQIEALFLSLVVICICGEQASLGQSSTGLPSFGSFQSGQIDTINENNLNVHLSIPLFHKAGRGFPLNFQMAFDSSDWTVVWNATKEDSQWQYTNGWGTWGVAASIGQLSDPGPRYPFAQIQSNISQLTQIHPERFTDLEATSIRQEIAVGATVPHFPPPTVRATFL
jgi:hypothetical protein